MYHNDVKKFIDACDQASSEKTKKLYLRLIYEEFQEFIDAVNDNDDVEQLDACMDMIWVIIGYCYMKQFDIEGAWGEVTRTNLEKIDGETGKVIKRDDGKIMKPSDWKEPDFKKYVGKSQ
jgi:NTP pyrophosphatase (non-canonical NTP hydrolase)